MTLQLHRAERTDLLADGLAALLAGQPLADPFARELVVVPARGVERWLTQRLSHRLGTAPGGGDGVCAGVDFVTPRSLVALLLGIDRTVAGDPWDPDRLVWPLLEVVDASAGQEWCRVLTAHLGLAEADDSPRRNRRYAVARRLAGLFASYADQRPQLVADWREGRDTDGLGGQVPADLAWQPELWRRLLQRVEAPAPDLRHTATLAALRAGGDGLELPPRLSLFGHTRISRSEAELLTALGEQRDVHLWLPQASAALWDRLAEEVAAGPVPRASDTTAHLVRHPLLASLGRDARELQRMLSGPSLPVESALVAAAGAHSTGREGPLNMLGWLQQDLRADAVPDAPTRAARRRTTQDRSVQVHACHGPARQVDVLREVLVGLLADDPTLEPRDILVMCPDVEVYAPLVTAAFAMDQVAGPGEGHPGHRLRVRLADRAPGATNPLLRIAARLVELAGGRLTATEVLDLAGEEPVRDRFGFTDDDLDRLRSWVTEAGVRWGLDAAHRGRYGLDLSANTWRSGLDRVLLGVALSGDDHRFTAGVLPLDDIGSGDVDLAGRFAELVDRLHAFLRAVDEASGVDDWATALRSGVAGLARASEPWMTVELGRELARLGVQSGGPGAGGAALPLRLADVRALLTQRLAGRPTRANFRTGTLTVCSMVPMRSVPHRVVALLGLDDGLFPRTTTTDGDDLLARTPVTGERDLRAEDRQLLLDAVLAARETLVVTYTGAAEHTGAVRPPAVPVGELMDALALTAEGAAELHLRHPLQPFDVRNLVPGALVPDAPFSFDTAALAGAVAAREPRVEVRELLSEPLPAPAGERVTELALADLKAFFAHPVRGFLRDRLGLAVPREAEPLQDLVPIELDPLQKWGVASRLLDDVLAGAEPGAGMTAELLRGQLPPGRLGEQQLRGVVEQVRPLVTTATGLRGATPRVLDVDILVATATGSVRLSGTVTDVYGNDLVTVGFSNLGAKQRYAAWIDLLALTVGHPDEVWRSHALGRYGRAARRALAGPLDERAEGWLAEAVDLWQRGQREPLPMPPKTTLAWAEEAARLRMGADADPDAKAAKQWVTDPFNDFGITGEDADPWHVRAWGGAAGRPAYDVLTGPARVDERWDDSGDGAPHRLGQLAWRMWSPLLAGAELVRSI